MVTDADTSVRGTVSAETVTTTDSGWGSFRADGVVPWLIPLETIEAATKNALKKSITRGFCS